MVGVCRRVSPGQGQEACTIYPTVLYIPCAIAFARLCLHGEIRAAGRWGCFFSVWSRVPLRVLLSSLLLLLPLLLFFLFFFRRWCVTAHLPWVTRYVQAWRGGGEFLFIFIHLFILFCLFIFVPDHPWSTASSPLFPVSFWSRNVYNDGSDTVQ